MNVQFFLFSMLSQAFALLFLWLFMNHRYRKMIAGIILIVSFLFTGLIDYYLSIHFSGNMSREGILFFLLILSVTVITTFLLNRHRDSRAFFIGFSAATFSLAIFVFGLLIFHFHRNAVFVLVRQSVFGIVVLLLLQYDSKKTPLPGLLHNNLLTRLLSLIPLLCFLAIFATSLYPGDIDSYSVCRTLAVIMIILMFCFYYLVITLLRIQYRANEARSNNELLKAYSSGLKQQIREMDRTQSEVSIIRHDARHHADLIQCYLDAGNYEAIRKLCKRHLAELDATVVKRFCSNITVNWVLSSYSREAEQKKVEFRCSVVIPELVPETEYEFGTVILNLLENAFRAVEKEPDEKKRYVDFLAYPVKGQIFLSVSNPFVGTVRIAPETGLPVSDRGEEHGYGLRSVIAFTRKNGGTVDFQTDQGIFNIRILCTVREAAGGSGSETGNT